MSKGFTVIDVPQRSPEWFAARLGRLTGSVAGKMLATVKTGEAAGRRDLRVRLAVERLTNQPEDDGNGFTSDAMQWGIDQEDHAFAAYEALTGNLARKTGFCRSDERMTGASLDGHLGNFDVLVSLKCPKSSTHYGYLKGDHDIPASYVPQMLHELWVTGAREYHFLSYDPRFDGKLQTFLVTVLRSEVMIEEYAAKATSFLAEVDAEVKALQAL